MFIHVSIIILHASPIKINISVVYFEVPVAVLKPFSLLYQDLWNHNISTCVLNGIRCLRSIILSLCRSGLWTSLVIIHNSDSNSMLFFILMYIMSRLGHGYWLEYKVHEKIFLNGFSGFLFYSKLECTITLKNRQNKQKRQAYIMFTVFGLLHASTSVESTLFYPFYILFILLPHYLRQLPLSLCSSSQYTDSVVAISIACPFCWVVHRCCFCRSKSIPYPICFLYRQYISVIWRFCLGMTIVTPPGMKYHCKFLITASSVLFLTSPLYLISP